MELKQRLNEPVAVPVGASSTGNDAMNGNESVSTREEELQELEELEEDFKADLVRMAKGLDVDVYGDMDAQLDKEVLREDARPSTRGSTSTLTHRLSVSSLYDEDEGHVDELRAMLKEAETTSRLSWELNQAQIEAQALDAGTEGQAEQATPKYPVEKPAKIPADGGTVEEESTNVSALIEKFDSPQKEFDCGHWENNTQSDGMVRGAVNDLNAKLQHEQDHEKASNSNSSTFEEQSIASPGPCTEIQNHEPFRPLVAAGYSTSEASVSPQKSATDATTHVQLETQDNNRTTELQDDKPLRPAVANKWSNISSDEQSIASPATFPPSEEVTQVRLETQDDKMQPVANPPVAPPLSEQTILSNFTSALSFPKHLLRNKILQQQQSLIIPALATLTCMLASSQNNTVSISMTPSVSISGIVLFALTI